MIRCGVNGFIIAAIRPDGAMILDHLNGSGPIAGVSRMDACDTAARLALARYAPDIREVLDLPLATSWSLEARIGEITIWRLGDRVAVLVARILEDAPAVDAS